MSTNNETTRASEFSSPIRRRLTEKQAAARLALSVRTLQQWRVKGGGPPFLKLGSSVRYNEDDLEAWADAQVRNNTSESDRPSA